MKRAIGVLLAAIMGLLVVGVGQPAFAATDPIPGAWYEIFPPAFNPNECLDVPNGSTTARLQLQVFHCHGLADNGAPQRWRFFPQAGTPTRYEIRNDASGKCVFADWSGANGSPVVQDGCDSLIPQGLWTIDTDTLVRNAFGLRSVAFPNMCMATSNSSGNDRTHIEISICNLLDKNDDAAVIRQNWSI